MHYNRKTCLNYYNKIEEYIKDKNKIPQRLKINNKVKKKAQRKRRRNLEK